MAQVKSSKTYKIIKEKKKDTYRPLHLVPGHEFDAHPLLINDLQLLHDALGQVATTQVTRVRKHWWNTPITQKLFISPLP